LFSSRRPAIATAQSSTATSGTTKPLQSAPPSGNAQDRPKAVIPPAARSGEKGLRVGEGRGRHSDRDQADQVAASDRERKRPRAKRSLLVECRYKRYHHRGSISCRRRQGRNLFARHCFIRVSPVEVFEPLPQGFRRPSPADHVVKTAKQRNADDKFRRTTGEEEPMTHRARMIDLARSEVTARRWSNNARQAMTCAADNPNALRDGECEGQALANLEIALIKFRQISQQRGDLEVRCPSSNVGR
jgi:hypothetical protein